jgi:hypothetical protein
MILFEANAVAPLVNLPDAAAEETVQWEWSRLWRLREEKSPPATALAKTARMDHPTSRAQLQGRNFKGEENWSSAKASGISGILAPSLHSAA